MTLFSLSLLPSALRGVFPTNAIAAPASVPPRANRRLVSP